MQVHHGYDTEGISVNAVNNGVRKAVKVKLAILAPDFSPAFRRTQDAVQSGLIFIEKIAAASNSSGTSGCLTTRMKLRPDVSHHLFL